MLGLFFRRRPLHRKAGKGRGNRKKGCEEKKKHSENSFYRRLEIVRKESARGGARRLPSNPVQGTRDVCLACTVNSVRAQVGHRAI